MFSIRIRQQERAGESWRGLAEAVCDLGHPIVLPRTEVSESDLLSLRITPPPGVVPEVRVFVGSVLVASSLPIDRVVLIDPAETDRGEIPRLVCKGRFLADWVGVTELAVEVRLGKDSGWAKVLELPLAVSAGKLAAEEFNRLFTELERDAAAVLFDIHGKTQIGIKSVGPLTSSSPVAVLTRIRATVRELTDVLHQMARQPASRLRIQRTREHALVGQAISDATLAEACRDPSLLEQHGSRLVFREHLREHTRLDYRIPEHRTIADFSEFIKAQLADLRQRIELEIGDRESRKSWRNAAREANQPTWWEAEDLPRIEQLERCGEEVVRMWGVVDGWGQLPFLPPGQCSRQKPRSTPLFRNNAVYRRAFRVMAGHFLANQATLDTHQLLTRARSLPVLYEWWCAVQVIRILSRGLTPVIHDPLARPIIALQFAQEGGRFTIDFASDQAINFTDRRGARVRFRYLPKYSGSVGGAGRAVAVLDTAASRTPDMALEVYPLRSGPVDLPELIVVLDAKYSSMTQWEKMQEVSSRYSKLGDARTGRVLSRQVWALTPVAPAGVGRWNGLRDYCTVDNRGFWSEEFDLDNPVNGAVQTRPIAPGSFDPLANLLVSLLRKAGIEYSPTVNAAPAE